LPIDGRAKADRRVVVVIILGVISLLKIHRGVSRSLAYKKSPGEIPGLFGSLSGVSLLQRPETSRPHLCGSDPWQKP